MKLLKSFFYAFRGIWHCVRLERNFRIHITAAVTVIVFSVLYGLPLTAYPPVIIVIALVMASEAVNTAVERTVDLSCAEKRTLAEIAKDAAAAGVLISAISAVAVAVFTFSDTEKLLAVIMRFQNPYMLAGFVIYIICFILFIFKYK